MIPFRVTFEAGTPIWEQVVYAARKAVVSGQMRPGDPFPSVRTLSAELRINPNTAHKVVSALLAEGVVEVHVGIGTVVASLPLAPAAERTRLLKREVEQLVVEAKRLGIELDQVQTAVARHWERLSVHEEDEVKRK
jgi:GntR family transcriptional regulator